ncbi:MAG TPA: ATP synthase subunit I [Blastocatellia bacterium]
MPFYFLPLLDKFSVALIKSAPLSMAETGDRETPSDGSDLPTDEQSRFTAPSQVERRMWRNIIAVVVIAAIASAPFVDRRFTLGLLLGGAMALFNFKWLHGSLRSLLEEGERRPPPGTSMKFILRWVIIGLIVYGASRTGYFDPVAIIAGLFAPAFAAMIEAGYVTYKTISEDRGKG